ncbi:MAG TPA: DUF3341 domain-containing protein [Dongiaceae bacterium]|nr:DUF3341 domain-containing protein [Dongiaceae bacterium]
MTAERLYGVLAEFDGTDALLAAVRAAHKAGARRLDSYTPFPVEPLEELITGTQRLLPVLAFAFGMLGLLGFFLLEYWFAAVNYPLNIGGRPLNSWPAFVPSCFEVGLIWAVGAAFVLFFALSRMPRLSHPLHAVPGFDRASQDALFLCVEAEDPNFDRDRLHALFRRHRAIRIVDVPA